MIYLHCGLPKTGTCSLQAALVQNENKLAAAGILYPEKWRRDQDGSHNDLDAVLATSRRAPASVEEFKSFLRRHSDKDIVLSSEALFLWTASEERLALLLNLLAAAEEIAPVKCVWTLRRLDQVVSAWYQQARLAEIELAPAAQFVSGLEPRPESFQRVEDAVSEAVYVKYDAGGGHQAKLLRACGIPSDVVTAVEGEIRAAPRRNVSLTHKQAVAVLYADALSVRAGVVLERVELLNAFRLGGFQFEKDGPWQLVDERVKRDLHEKMLKASLALGFTPYPQFFEDESVGGRAAASPMDPDVLSNEDLNRLVAFYGLSAGKSASSSDAVGQSR